jgi:hypothetical protein
MLKFLVQACFVKMEQAFFIIKFYITTLRRNQDN